MVVADVVRNNSMTGQTGIWLLAVFLLGLSVMAWLTVREASLYETKSAIRNLRKNRKPSIPDREKLSILGRTGMVVRSIMRGNDIAEPFDTVVGAAEYGFEFRLRREIDNLVGKEVYHGQKEQL